MPLCGLGEGSNPNLSEPSFSEGIASAPKCPRGMSQGDKKGSPKNPTVTGFFIRKYQIKKRG